ncbi:hypothetical protein H4R35_006830, partial [Dimargaris xerosporica]
MTNIEGYLHRYIRQNPKYRLFDYSFTLLQWVRASDQVMVAVRFISQCTQPKRIQCGNLVLAVSFITGTVDKLMAHHFPESMRSSEACRLLNDAHKRLVSQHRQRWPVYHLYNHAEFING